MQCKVAVPNCVCARSRLIGRQRSAATTVMLFFAPLICLLLFEHTNNYLERLVVIGKEEFEQGTSGGARVITYVKIIETSIFLLSIYDKADAANISDKELKERLRGLR